ncbi:hypothetical protein V6N12_036146 [Hibiscus sabdariffa]|uniref:Uncharacterized protein n=1 Tax=Hibiscus sabdariffa TaxID=183260 RepID=A0ABR2EPT5_9ROSI
MQGFTTLFQQQGSSSRRAFRPITTATCSSSLVPITTPNRCYWAETKRTVLASNTKDLPENQGREDDSTVSNEDIFVASPLHATGTYPLLQSHAHPIQGVATNSSHHGPLSALPPRSGLIRPTDVLVMGVNLLLCKNPTNA